MKRGIDYIGVGVGAILVNEEGRIFLARRGPKAKNEQGLWEFPGGSVEFGETLAEALQREMYEEYGIKASVGVLVDVVDHILPQNTNTGFRQHLYVKSYQANHISVNLKNAQGSGGLAWIKYQMTSPKLQG